MKRCPKCNSLLAERHGLPYCPFCETSFPKDVLETQNGPNQKSSHAKEIFNRACGGVFRTYNGVYQGTAFLIDKKKKLALTNTHVLFSSTSKNHLIRNNGDVILENGQIIPFKVLKSNPEMLHPKADTIQNDVAFIELSEIAPNMVELPIASKQVEVGENVYCLGNSLGRGIVLTQGIISAIHAKENSGGTDMIIADISTNVGNSGGPLLNEKGEVVGICVSSGKDSNGNIADGMRYFIPIYSALAYLKGNNA